MDDDCHKKYLEEERNQTARDSELLAKVKERISKKIFDNVTYELNECCASNFSIVSEPIGDKQCWNGYNTWVVQHCGCCEDDYYGTVCMKITKNEYIKWNFHD